MTARWAQVRSLLPGPADYRLLRSSWRADIVAGVTVGIVALPLALAFGVSSGAGAAAGLVTAIVAGIVAAVFGGSNVQVSGPTGAMVVVLAPIVAAHGVGAVAVVAVMAGVLVVLAGLLRLGRVVGIIPWPVIEGFTVGIAIIIFLQQVPAALGVGHGHSLNALVAAVQAVGAADWHSAILPLGVVAVIAVIMLGLTRISPRIPASFLAIAIVTIVATVAGLPLVLIGELPRALPIPGLPLLDPAILGSLAGPAVAVAALAAIESLLSARVADSLSDTGPYHPDRELVGQGLASIAAGLFGGMPATGAIARTAVNVRTGARTRVAVIVHSLALLAVVYLAANIVSLIPLAALSGVLMVTAARMASLRTIRRVLRSTRADALVFLITALVTVSFDLVIAVCIGVAAAALFALRALSAGSGVHREELPGDAMDGDGRIALFRIDGALFFGAADRITERMSQQAGIDVVILRLSQLQLLDASGAHTLAELVTLLERRGITVLIKGIRPEHMRLLTEVGATRALRHPNHLFDELEPAVQHARSHVERARAGG
ncbi:SulP family inorganic anion transporter [soil metagenome]